MQFSESVLRATWASGMKMKLHRKLVESGPNSKQVGKKKKNWEEIQDPVSLHNSWSKSAKPALNCILLKLYIEET